MSDNMTKQQIPFVVVEEVKTGLFRVDLWATAGAHIPTDKPFVSIYCAGIDTGKLPDTDGAAPITLWDSTGEVITTLYPHRSALKLQPCRAYIPQPYFDPALQQSSDTEPRTVYARAGTVAAVMSAFDKFCHKLGNVSIGDIHGPRS